ncbi:hypothetical protein L1049_000116 [Liquidambar formosana]|uniref:SURP motif domain-containing protein n=1 Tax=Liquidambar formosana TaxID=63359 RepID=A0AAP0N881_LIQFO
MDLEVVGRHALLFDDDATAAFVNSSDALVDWNSLLIDRYDVRHLLPSPPPPRKRRRHSSPPLASSGDPLQLELDHERYLDLPSPSDEQDNGEECVDAGAYHSVAFSYGYPDDSANQKKDDAGFHPPFPVPESLLQSLPPTEKIHQIIARTAMFVSNHGGQSEIVLRVKQGDNPAFGFLMPDHHLHTYFRFLVDHPELLKSDSDGKYQEEDKKADTEDNQKGGVGGSGALSLLGSVYGSGEDEDGATEDAPKSIEIDSGGTFDALNATIANGLEQAEFSVNVAGKDDMLPKHPVPYSKEKAASKKIRSMGTVKAGTMSSLKKESDASSPLDASAVKSQASALPSAPKVETLILEPPSDLKRLVDKIVEFILKNGKEFEAVLVEQDSKHGRFPFLLPTNKYHPYYLKVLQKAQESKLTGKSFNSEKD